MKLAEEFKKYDDDKVMYSLIDCDFLRDFAEVLTHGAKKYGIDNWKLMDVEKEGGTRRYIDALLRHVEAYRRGEAIDPESGISHLAHACCNLMFLHWFDRRDPIPSELEFKVSEQGMKNINKVVEDANKNIVYYRNRCDEVKRIIPRVDVADPSEFNSLQELAKEADKYISGDTLQLARDKK